MEWESDSQSSTTRGIADGMRATEVLTHKYGWPTERSSEPGAEGYASYGRGLADSEPPRG